MGKLVNGVWVNWIEKVKILQKAVIQNNDSLFLVLKRGEKEIPRPNCWDFCGGSIDPEDIQKWKEKSGIGDKNDILINAVSREIFEETKLVVKTAKVIHIASGYDDSKGVFILAIAYICSVTNENNLELNKEHSEFKWIDKKELLNLDFGDTNGYYHSIVGSL